MKLKKLPLKAISAITLSGLFLVACDDTRVRISADGGHGYSGPRHHNGGHITRTPHNHRVSYDSALGMYIVLGLTNTYWNNGNYYRYYGNAWQRSSDYRRWSRLQQNRVPSRLYKRHYQRPVTYHNNNRTRHDNRGRYDNRDRNNNRTRIIRPGRTRPDTRWIH